MRNREIMLFHHMGEQTVISLQVDIYISVHTPNEYPAEYSLTAPLANLAFSITHPARSRYLQQV